ncbi:uncharacterized protein [Drosophila kikkawai]|uniref:Uncharacterized protein isoform X3 n=1 Tax=Drosophila kikkawai TaxID=30033 RepID=A0ABM4GFN7_DROKI
MGVLDTVAGMIPGMGQGPLHHYHHVDTIKTEHKHEHNHHHDDLHHDHYHDHDHDHDHEHDHEHYHDHDHDHHHDDHHHHHDDHHHHGHYHHDDYHGHQHHRYHHHDAHYNHGPYHHYDHHHHGHYHHDNHHHHGHHHHVDHHHHHYNPYRHYDHHFHRNPYYHHHYPINPFDPIFPFDPIYPFDPILYFDPIRPVDTNRTVDPIPPVEPIPPVDPIRPVHPARPVGPILGYSPVFYMPQSATNFLVSKYYRLPQSYISYNGQDIGINAEIDDWRDYLAMQDGLKLLIPLLLFLFLAMPIMGSLYCWFCGRCRNCRTGSKRKCYCCGILLAVAALLMFLFLFLAMVAASQLTKGLEKNGRCTQRSLHRSPRHLYDPNYKPFLERIEVPSDAGDHAEAIKDLIEVLKNLHAGRLILEEFRDELPIAKGLAIRFRDALRVVKQNLKEFLISHCNQQQCGDFYRDNEIRMLDEGCLHFDRIPSTEDLIKSINEIQASNFVNYPLMAAQQIATAYRNRTENQLVAVFKNLHKDASLVEHRVKKTRPAKAISRIPAAALRRKLGLSWYGSTLGMLLVLMILPILLLIALVVKLFSPNVGSGLLCAFLTAAFMLFSIPLVLVLFYLVHGFLTYNIFCSEYHQVPEKRIQFDDRPDDNRTDDNPRNYEPPNDSPPDDNPLDGGLPVLRSEDSLYPPGENPSDDNPPVLRSGATLSPLDDNPLDDNSLNDSPPIDNPLDDSPSNDNQLDDSPPYNNTPDNNPPDGNPLDDSPPDDNPLDDNSLNDSPPDNNPLDDNPPDDNPLDDNPLDDIPPDDNQPVLRFGDTLYLPYHNPLVLKSGDTFNQPDGNPLDDNSLNNSPPYNNPLDNNPPDDNPTVLRSGDTLQRCAGNEALCGDLGLKEFYVNTKRDIRAAAEDQELLRSKLFSYNSSEFTQYMCRELVPEPKPGPLPELISRLANLTRSVGSPPFLLNQTIRLQVTHKKLGQPLAAIIHRLLGKLKQLDHLLSGGNESFDTYMSRLLEKINQFQRRDFVDFVLDNRTKKSMKSLAQARHFHGHHGHHHHGHHHHGDHHHGHHHHGHHDDHHYYHYNHGDNQTEELHHDYEHHHQHYHHHHHDDNRTDQSEKLAPFPLHSYPYLRIAI